MGPLKRLEIAIGAGVAILAIACAYSLKSANLASVRETELFSGYVFGVSVLVSISRSTRVKLLQIVLLLTAMIGLVVLTANQGIRFIHVALIAFSFLMFSAILSFIPKELSQKP